MLVVVSLCHVIISCNRTLSLLQVYRLPMPCVLIWTSITEFCLITTAAQRNLHPLYATADLETVLPGSYNRLATHFARQHDLDQ